MARVRGNARCGRIHFHCLNCLGEIRGLFLLPQGALSSLARMYIPRCKPQQYDRGNRCSSVSIVVKSVIIVTATGAVYAQYKSLIKCEHAK